MAARQFADAALVFGAGPLRMDERHRMRFDQRVDDELHSGEADAARRETPPLKRRRRIGDVQHHVGAGVAQGPTVDLRLVEIQTALIDRPGIALGAGYSVALPVAHDAARLARADDGRPHPYTADDPPR